MSPTPPSTSTHTPSSFLTHHDYRIHKNRKHASTGGGRAWSEEEEIYLLQTRLQKMPYKHIAAHLHKTELACRLHYHQLSHGPNRRKRSVSVSPVPPTITSPVHEHASVSPPTSPHPAPTAHIAILPKPPPPPHPLRLNCAIPPHTASSIDQSRLRRIYDARRVAFWCGVAAEYGEGVTPGLLEEVWRRGTGMLPTPCGSPDQERGETRERRGSARRASISGLLGIDASPRSGEERELIRRLEEGLRMEMV